MPSGRTLIFAGLRSRWIMPRSCAASKASAICFAIGKHFIDRERPLRDAVRQRRSLDQLHHEGRFRSRSLETVDLRDVGMVQRGEDFGLPLEPG